MAEHSEEQRSREPEHGGEQPRQEPEQEAEHPVDARLRVYLRQLVAAQGGRMKAAQELGVNYKTLARGLDEPGPLTVWLRAALLVKALEDGVTALAAADEQEPENPEPGDASAEVSAGRVTELASEVRDATAALRTVVEAVEPLGREHGERLATLEERLDAVEAQPESSQAEAVPVIGAPRIHFRMPVAGALPRQTPPTVVTEEAGPGDEDAYGAAWPLVEEWRALHGRHPPEGRGVDWLRDEERLRELEIALIAEHELALPPERYRWDGFTRRSQLRWRERTLRRVRGERRRAQWGRWLRRLLTLGIWLA